MRAFLFTVLLMLIVMGAIVFWWKSAYPTYAYRYRLTIEVEVDGKTRTGSSVIEVRWIGQPYIPGVGSFMPRVLGQAALVDLGTKGAVAAVLFTGEGYGIASDGAVDARFLASRAFGNDSTYQQLPALPRLLGRSDLASDNIPRLVWFSDPSDVKTGKKILPDEIPNLLGPAVKLVGAHVEITKERIVADIGAKFPWLSEMIRQQKAHGITTYPGQFQLFYQMFAGEGT